MRKRVKGPLVENSTDYRTDDLRRFFAAGLKEAGAGLAKRIIVQYSRRVQINGEATLGHTDRYEQEGYLIKMWLPRPKHGFNLKLLAQIFLHEVGHTMGLQHKEMQSYPEIECSFHEDREIRVKTPRRKPTMAERVEKREIHARAKVVQLERRIKRFTTRLKKWKGKVRYYERGREKAALKKKGR